MDEFLKKSIYTYLGYKNIEENNEIDDLIIELIEEVKEYSRFQYVYQEFDYLVEFLKKPEYSKFVSGLKGYFLVGTTLGFEIDKRIRFYSKTNLTKMVVLDACSSAYLEYLADNYEKELKENLTYRFCPGYQGTSVKDISVIHKILKLDKIGIEINENGIMIPQKSMVGIVGIGKSIKKSCVDCMLKEKCVFKKEGRTCYN